MRYLIGLFRIIVAALALAAGATLILLLSPVPFRVRGAKLCAWPATWLARLCLPLFGVSLHVHERERVVRHGGFLFPNHVSFLDAILLLSLAPMRFLGKSEVRSWPLVGWMASAIGTVWVQRADKESRARARDQLRDLPRHPPIALFPEGGIYPTGKLLNPFRWGAFEIAIHSQIPYLPCVLVYDQRDLVFWGDESLMAVVWRVASRKGGSMRAELIPLRLVQPAPTDDAPQLAAEAHGAIESILLAQVDQDQVVQEGI